MKKICCIYFILTLLNLSKCNENSIYNNSISKLIGMVRTEIIDKILLHLPKREDVNLFQMIREMIKAKEENSFNDTESAYLVFKWITKNIKAEYIGDHIDEPTSAYSLGKGSTKGMSSLFNNMCNLLKVESGSISGYLKWTNIEDYGINLNIEFFWNYVEIDGHYYLIDVTKASDMNEFYSNFFSDYTYLYFCTDPEVFIRMHYPKESKWQLLPEPYTYEKFESMAALFPLFYLFGCKTISPDTDILAGSGKIIISSDKPIPELDLYYNCKQEYDDGVWDATDGSNKIEIEYDIQRDKCISFSIFLKQPNKLEFEPIAIYNTKFTYGIYDKYLI